MKRRLLPLPYGIPSLVYELKGKILCINADDEFRAGEIF